MEQDFDKLEAVLCNEINTHEALIEIAGTINTAIHENNLAALQQNTARYDQQIGVLEKFEAYRLECCTELAKSMGIGEKRIHMSAILVKSPKAKRQQLETKRRALKGKIGQLKNINLSNTILLDELIKVIAGMFTIYQKSSNRLNGYRHKGDLAASSQVRRNIFNQVI